MTIEHYKASEDLYVIQLPERSFLDTEEYLVYAPLRNRAVKVTGDDLQLMKSGDTRILDLHKFTASQSRDPLPGDPQRPYDPTDFNSVMLGITSRCNLRCRYCFADGGDYNNTPEMTWDVVEAWLKLVPEAAKKNGNSYHLTFHGDGETLTSQSLMFKIIDAFKALGQEYKFKTSVGMTTNATLINETNIEQIAKSFDSLNVSFDGDAVAQAENRPLPGNKSSVPSFIKAIQLLNKHRVKFQIRSTITKNSVSRMPDMVDFCADVLNCNSLHFEPATDSNRAHDDNSLSPDPSDFIHFFKLAQDRAQKRGVTLFSSTQRANNLSSAFCGTPNAALTILADGSVTACSRITHPDDPFISKYVFAKYNKETTAFDFDLETIANLRKNTVVQAYPECNDCWAKFHCAGGCSANRERGTNDYLCQITKDLTLHQILNKYNSNQFKNQQELIAEQRNQLMENS